MVADLHRIVLDNLKNEQFGVQQLADTYGVSRSQLHKRLKKTVNKSISQFIREIRLDKAMDLLKEGDSSVSEIAYEVGFSSPTYFNSTFREYYGYPPGEVKFREDREQNGRQAGNHRKKMLAFFISLFFFVLIAVWVYYDTRSNSLDVSPLLPRNAEMTLQPRSIAVLPLKNWSGDPSLQFIGDGMTEAVISKLLQIESIEKVVPFTSVTAYRGRDENIPEISRDLGVGYILDGNFQLSGDRIKISLQLIDGPSDTHYWSQEYTGKWESDDVFTLQRQVAGEVAANMDIRLTEAIEKALERRPTTNHQAYIAYLKGAHLYTKQDKGSREQAIAQYVEAIRLDTTFVDAHLAAAASWLWGGAIWGAFPEEKAWREARQSLRKAAAIEPKNNQQQNDIRRLLLNGSYIYEWDLQGMEEAYLNENYTDLKALYEIHTGRYRESYQTAGDIMNSLPTSQYSYTALAQAMYFMGQEQACIALLDKHLPLFGDDLNFLRESSKYFFYTGEYDRAGETLAKFLKAFPDRPAVVLWLQAVLGQKAGDKESETTALEALCDQYSQNQSGSPAWFLALYYAFKGDTEPCMDWLKRSYSRHEAEMLWLKSEPLLRPYHHHKAYLQLYQKMGYPQPLVSSFSEN